MIIGPADGFTPRIYQDECINGNRRWLGILRALARYQRVLAVLATGLGKTEIFLYLIRRFLESEKTPPTKRALILAHRNELVDQPIARAHRFGLRIAREQGASTGVGKPERVIASTIQSMTANRVTAAARDLGYKFSKSETKVFTVVTPGDVTEGPYDLDSFTAVFKARHPKVPTMRMEEYGEDELGLIIIDESHHAPASDYRKLLDRFPNAYILGVTATPHRLDGVALEEIFKAHAFSYPLLEATDDGWLVPIRAIRQIIEGLDLDKLRSRCGDLPPGGLGELLAEYVHPVARDIVRLAEDRPTIVFCPTVPHAYAQAEALRRYTDARVECAFSGTPKRKGSKGQQSIIDGVVTRDDMVDDFKAGKVRFLVNCELFTEGFDAPNARCIAIVRPTQSASLVTQMVGRGTRPLSGVVDRPELRDDPAGRIAAIAASDKPDVLVIHFTAKSAKHSLVGPVDALAGNLTTAERLALTKIPLTGELTVDQALQAARIAAAEEAARLAAEQAELASHSYELDPFHPVCAMGIKGLRDDPNEARASEKMAKFLARNGVSDAAKLSASTARKLQQTIIVRTKLQLASIPQAIALQRAGVPVASTIRMTTWHAGELMAELHSHHGVRPRRWDSDPLLGGQARGASSR